MKKILFGIIATTFIMTGCSNNNLKVSSETTQKITWTVGGNLDAPTGFTKQHGVAGPLAGNINNKIIIAGGANFPYKSVLEGGAKKHYPDLYVLEEKNGKLETINHQLLKQETGYGSTVSTENGIYYIGGANDSGISNKIYHLTLTKDNKINVHEIGELPFTYFGGTIAIKNNILYIVNGKHNGKDSNDFYSYNLITKETKKLPNYPGEARSQSVGQILNNGQSDAFYVFSGGSNIAYTDGFAYNFNTNKWEKVNSVKVNNKEISLLGASSVKLNNNELLVIGGFNKEVYDNAVKNLSTLKDKQLQNFKEKYFTTDPQDFNWNKNILIYNAKDNTWKSIGEVPFNAPCGEGLVLIGNKLYSINGEIKPGVRTEKMYIGTIN
ncbi:cyclically-permuted mutarotase family protein [Cetobacterium sp. SF1]|uniref:cyclically-permuted mutarotase family protein n=1 Tax=Cetobacterium sp. SF1 TaxID=3417654 RepID=UPI003CF4EB6B